MAVEAHIDELDADIKLFVDHYVIIRKDGTRVLNGSEEELRASLRALIELRIREKSNV